MKTCDKCDNDFWDKNPLLFQIYASLQTLEEGHQSIIDVSREYGFIITINKLEKKKKKKS